MVDEFFEGALDGCGAIAGIAMAITLGLLLVQLLFSPIFWVLAGLGLSLGLAHRRFRTPSPRQVADSAARLADLPHDSGSPGPYIAPSISQILGDSWLSRFGDDPLPGPPLHVHLEFDSCEPSVFYEHENGIPYRGHEAAKKRID